MRRIALAGGACVPVLSQGNVSALDAGLTREDLDALDRAFLPPSGPRPLEIL